MTVDPLNRFSGYALRRASNVTLADLAPRLAVLGLRVAEASVLVVIAANPGITQADVGRLLGMTATHLAPRVASLDQAGHLLRRPLGRRAQGLSLTPQGQALAQAVTQAMHEHEKALLERVPAHLLPALKEALHYLWKPVPPE